MEKWYANHFYRTKLRVSALAFELAFWWGSRLDSWLVPLGYQNPCGVADCRSVRYCLCWLKLRVKWRGRYEYWVVDDNGIRSKLYKVHLVLVFSKCRLLLHQSQVVGWTVIRVRRRHLSLKDRSSRLQGCKRQHKVVLCCRRPGQVG